MAKLVLGTNKNNTGTSSVVVEKPTPMPLSIQKSKNASGKVSYGNVIIDLDGATDVEGCSLAYAYIGNNNISGTVDMSSLTGITGYASVSGGSHGGIFGACEGMFDYCRNITGANLHNVKTIGWCSCYQMFVFTNVKNVDLHCLETINGNFACSSMFYGCGVESIDLSNLKTISGYNACSSMFGGNMLTNVSFDKLESINSDGALSYAFRTCNKNLEISFPALKSTSFGSYTNQFNYMVWDSRCESIIVHFPSNLESVIGNWNDILTGYGYGSKAVTLFDLPATE